jgi:hypothetical protein
VTAILVFVVIWWFGPFRNGPTGKTGDFLPPAWKSDPVLAEVNQLVENALPSVYQDISGESYSGFDDGFMQFVVPPAEPEPLSLDSNGKGVFQC